MNVQTWCFLLLGTNLYIFFFISKWKSLNGTRVVFCLNRRHACISPERVRFARPFSVRAFLRGMLCGAFFLLGCAPDQATSCRAATTCTGLSHASPSIPLSVASRRHRLNLQGIEPRLSFHPSPHDFPATGWAGRGWDRAARCTPVAVRSTVDRCSTPNVRASRWHTHGLTRPRPARPMAREDVAPALLLTPRTVRPPESNGWNM